MEFQEIYATMGTLGLSFEGVKTIDDMRTRVKAWLAIVRMEIDYSLNNGHFVTLLLILCK